MPKTLTGIQDGHYYEATKEGRGRNAETAVKVWKGETKEGEPAEEWIMPGMLPISLAITQAIIQTKT